MNLSFPTLLGAPKFGDLSRRQKEKFARAGRSSKEHLQTRQQKMKDFIEAAEKKSVQELYSDLADELKLELESPYFIFRNKLRFKTTEEGKIHFLKKQTLQEMIVKKLEELNGVPEYTVQAIADHMARQRDVYGGGVKDYKVTTRKMFKALLKAKERAVRYDAEQAAKRQAEREARQALYAQPTRPKQPVTMEKLSPPVSEYDRVEP